LCCSVLIAACDPCRPKACKPSSWSGDCHCDPGSVLEVHENGLVVCHCSDGQDGGAK
jgi:hypothetical protein